MEEGYTYSQALAEANRCLLCHDAPCSKNCPAGTAPATFIRKFRLKNIKGAIRTIKENNILGGCCGVVCPIEQLCQKGCVAASLSKPIEIGKIQRFLVEHGWETNFDPLSKCIDTSKPEVKDNRPKVAIIGSGPAGLACAAELGKSGYNSQIFEAKAEAGGVLRYGVPPFRLNPEFLEKELEDVKALGTKISCNQSIGKDGVKTLLEEGFSAVFLAPGIWQPYELDIPGIELENSFNATEFLELIKKGKADYLKKMVNGKNVGVTGGGSVAMDVANTCKALGANKVYVIYRRSVEQMPASKDDLDMARDNFVIIRPQSVVKELIGSEGVVTGLRGIETDWVERDNFRSSNLKEVKGTEFSLLIDTFVTAIGSGPDKNIQDLCPQINYRKNGQIVVDDESMKTNDKQVFAGGDVIRGSGTVVGAVADGRKAAQAIISALIKDLKS